MSRSDALRRRQTYGPPVLGRCTHCGMEEKICPKCRTGRLVQRRGPYGPFLGRTQYPSHYAPCDYALDLYPPKTGPSRRR